MNPVIDQMIIKEENLSALEVELPVKAEEDNSIEVILQDIVIEIIPERDLRTQIDSEFDPERILWNHIMDPENNLNVIEIDPEMCHHDLRTLIIIGLEISFPDSIRIHIINPEVQVLIPDQGETIVAFNVSIVWDTDI